MLSHSRFGAAAEGRAAPVLMLAVGLALADASVVTFALPELLVELRTSVEGVAAVIGVYAAILALALLPAERLSRKLGAARVGAAGFALFGLASVACALAGSLEILLAARAVQAIGGAVGLVAVFSLLVEPGGSRSVRASWLRAAVLSTAMGPAFGGAITQILSWEWIFVAQAPVLLLADAGSRDRLSLVDTRRRRSVAHHRSPRG